MSRVRKEDDEPIAVLGSDLHLTNKVPVARAEDNWLTVLEGYLDQVSTLCRNLGEVPFLVAGDVFDKPTVPPEVVNFAIDSLPKRTWTIPGQHDLEYHSYEDIAKTSYWTLVKSGKVKHIIRGQAHLFREDVNENRHWYVVGWPWGSEPRPMNQVKGRTDKYLALVHAYCWAKNLGYKNAPMEGLSKKWARKLKGYTAAAFGDNHHSFQIQHSEVNLLNCGCFVRRRSDEKKYKPSVGVLYTSGKIEQVPLHTAGDKWCTPEQLENKADDLSQFEELVSELNTLGADSLDFMEALKAGMSAKQVGRAVGNIIRQAAEKANEKG